MHEDVKQLFAEIAESHVIQANLHEWLREHGFESIFFELSNAQRLRAARKMLPLRSTDAQALRREL